MGKKGVVEKHLSVWLHSICLQLRGKKISKKNKRRKRDFQNQGGVKKGAGVGKNRLE